MTITKTKNQLPWQIQTIIDQAGGRGIHGAFGYIGAHQFGYMFNPDDPNFSMSKFEDGYIHYGCGLRFKPNGKKNWLMVIALDADKDTYSVYLMAVGNIQTGCRSKLLDSMDDVYCDMLQDIVEKMYDRAIEKYCDGFIPC